MKFWESPASMGTTSQFSVMDFSNYGGERGPDLLDQMRRVLLPLSANAKHDKVNIMPLHLIDDAQLRSLKLAADHSCHFYGHNSRANAICA